MKPLYQNAGKISRVRREVPDKHIAIVVFNINVTFVPSIRNYCTLKTVSQIFLLNLLGLLKKELREVEGKTQCLD